MQSDNIFIALTISALIMLLNIVAVTSGIADAVYAPVSHWLNAVF